MDLAQMKENARKALEAMKSAGKELTEAQGKESPDADAVKGKQDAYDKAKKAFDSAKKTYEQALEQHEAEKSLGDMDNRVPAKTSKAVDDVDEDAPEMTGKSFGGGHGKAAAQPKNYEKEMDDHTQVFHKYLSMGKERLSGQENDLLAPQSTSFEKGAGGVKAPPHLVAQLMGTKWMAHMGMEKELNHLRRKASTMVSGTDALGGYTVPQDYRLPVLEVPGEEPFIMNRATVIPAPTGTVTMPKGKQTDSDEYGGFSGSWISEGGDKPKTDTQFEQLQIQCHEYAAHTQLSIRLLERSAIAMESWVTRKGRAKIQNEMNRVFLRGTGSGQPTGILNTAGIRTQARETAGGISRTDMVRLKRKLKPYHRSGGMFLMSDDAGGTLEELTVSNTDMRPLFSASMANGPYDRLLGFPYMETTQLPDTGTEGDVVFVDLREYYVAMESEIIVKRSDDYAITNNLATIIFYVVVGGRLIEPRVAALLSDTSTS